MDVRDKEINRFGEYVGGVVLGTAMIVPFGLALAEAEHFWIANAMYTAFVLSGLGQHRVEAGRLPPGPVAVGKATKVTNSIRAPGDSPTPR